MKKLIVASTIDGGIGLNQKLPWGYNKKDMEWFSRKTKGNVVVMGRKTWESLGCVELPERINIVVTTSELDEQHSHLSISGDMGVILGKLEENFPSKDIYVIGGADIYQQSIDHVDEVYWTVFREDYEYDTKIDVGMFDRFLFKSSVYMDQQIEIFTLS